jgi:hypothetical protein
MTLTLESLAAIRVALCIARLQHPGDSRFIEAYQEILREWAKELYDETPALMRKQA